MTVRVVGLVTVNENAAGALGAYLEQVTPLLVRAGARIEQRFRVHEVVVGPAPATSVMILNFPDRSAVESVFGSSAYKELRPLRDRAFRSYQVSIINDHEPLPGLE